MILRHAKMQIEWKGEKRGMREAKPRGVVHRGVIHILLLCGVQ